jgi:transposase
MKDSSADRRRLGHITKQGNSLVRYLLTEAAQAAVRYDPDWRRRYIHLSKRRERAIAKVAMGRRLAVSLYWRWRKGYDYQQHLEFGSHAGELVSGHGVNVRSERCLGRTECRPDRLHASLRHR